jgi:peptidoglycan/LPS O-acetylase OafA/YrhL
MSYRRALLLGIVVVGLVSILGMLAFDSFDWQQRSYNAAMGSCVGLVIWCAAYLKIEPKISQVILTIISLFLFLWFIVAVLSTPHPF